MVYALSFGLSALFAYIAKKCKRKAAFLLWSILSIAVMVLLAGLRDVSIGIDTENYYDGRWTLAMSSSSFQSYMEDFFLRAEDRVELLFAVLVGVVAKTTGNFHVYLTVVHLLIMVGVYVGAFRMRHHADPVFTLILFYLLYYNHSLNISRQYIAIAIIFAAAEDIEKGKHLRYLIFVVIASMFHNTGVLGVMPLIVYMVLYPKKNVRKVPISRRLLIFVLILALSYSFVPLAQFLIDKGYLSAHYASYFTEEEEAIPRLVILLLFLEVFLMAAFWKQIRHGDVHADFFLFCSILFLVIYQLATVIFYGKRIAAYFALLNIVFLGMVPKSMKKPANQRILAIAVFFVVLFYWLYFYVYQNASQTMPYLLGV